MRAELTAVRRQRQQQQQVHQRHFRSSEAQARQTNALLAGGGQVATTLPSKQRRMPLRRQRLSLCSHT